MTKPRECTDCKSIAPETETAHTLIGPRHGWRLSRGVNERGDYVPEWRCPNCWRVYKQAGGAASTGEFQVHVPDRSSQDPERRGGR